MLELITSLAALLYYPSAQAPATIDDALFRISGVGGPVVPVSDLDGDGTPDLVVERGNRYKAGGQIEIVSLRSGETIRVLWTSDHEFVWECGGDVDGDGVPDVLVGIPDPMDADEGSGRIVVVSGADACVLRCTPGAASGDRFGASLAFLDDVDGDGCDDYAVGAPQLKGAPDVRVRRLPDVIRVPGWVFVYSGRDGSEIWRTAAVPRQIGFGTHIAAIGDLDGDGARDLLAQARPRATAPIVLLSGVSGAAIAHFPHRGWWAGMGGDLDADGVADLYLEGGTGLDDDPYASGLDRSGSVLFLSGRSREPLFEIPYIDWLEADGGTVSVGDVDGDGYGDFGICTSQFHLPGPGDAHSPESHVLDFEELTLDELIRFESDPWCGGSHSGCALLYSGRSQEVLWGVFGRPGSYRCIGHEMAALPDVSGDGYPDLIVTGNSEAYVFAGPGPR